jgi:hypothetical protein
MDRVDKLSERARVLAESDADLDVAATELLGMTGGDRWVAEAALARTEAVAGWAPGDAVAARSVSLLRDLLALGALR